MPTPSTYDPALPTDKDWVRFFIGDRNTTAAVLSDAEISAVIGEEQAHAGPGEHVKYLAAARCGDILLTRMGNVVEKQVGDLRIRFGESSASTYRTHLSDLRKRGAFLLTPRPRAFRCL